LQRDRMEGSPVRRQCLQPRLRRLPARRAREARRELRCHDLPSEPTRAMSPKKADAKPGGGGGGSKRLGVAVVGRGFKCRFRLQAFRAVRDADVLGVWSPHKKNAASAAQLARDLDVGDAKPYASIADMVADPAIDAIWLTGPNQARVENV